MNGSSASWTGRKSLCPRYAAWGFEVVSPKDKHLGEVDFSMQVRKPANPSGGHNLKVK